MRKVQLLAASAVLMVPFASAVQAQESNPVTSDPPVNAIGRQSETSPGTPNRQNSAPGYRHGYSYYSGNTYYGPSAYDGAYDPDYGYGGASVVITPNAAIIDVE